MDVLATILTALIFGAAYGHNEAPTPESRIAFATEPTTAFASESTTVYTTKPTTEFASKPTTNAVVIPNTNTTVLRNCTTTWRLPGNCVLRLLCDNNTPAIDLTPYAPRGPKRLCSKGEVCCPVDLILTPEATPPEHKPDKFEFDDDD